ncbi:MAG: hypothetical protein JWP97_5518 [Labilithrix sp.]|nr:hypothetical protein [Labilithrix sp.]
MTPIRTRTGWADFGEYETFGRRLHRDLAGRLSLAGLLVFSVTGRVLAEEDVAVLDDLALAAHVPEPRVWPMKLARLVGSGGRAMTGYLAAGVVLDGDYIGIDAVRGAAQSLLALAEQLASAPDRAAAIGAFVAGHGRLAVAQVQQRPRDERVVALADALARRGLAGRRWWSLFVELWSSIEASHGVRPGIFQAAAAALLDASLSPDEAASVSGFLLQPQFLMHAHDGAAQRSDTLRRMPDEAISYVGPPPRRTPR